MKKLRALRSIFCRATFNHPPGVMRVTGKRLDVAVSVDCSGRPRAYVGGGGGGEWGVGGGGRGGSGTNVGRNNVPLLVEIGLTDL